MLAINSLIVYMTLSCIRLRCYCRWVLFISDLMVTLHSQKWLTLHHEGGVASMTKGEMAEWSIAAVLKTVELRGSGGSNPSLSAEVKGVSQDRLTPFIL